MATDAESRRLAECRGQGVAWRKWGPYLSERQWGTVREYYSDNGDAWSYFSHDQARSRAYGWGEDGLAGFSDENEYLCLALALWNGVDPILQVNRTRSRHEPEYELLDTGVFADDRYFDVVVEYAKAGPEDVLMRVTATNRGPESAPLHVLPTLWFRDVWTADPGEVRPLLRRAGGDGRAAVVAASHRDLGARWLACAGTPELLLTENETNRERLFGEPNRVPYVKDAFHRLLVGGEAEAVNPDGTGTKAAAHYRLEVPAGGPSSAVRRSSTDPHWRDCLLFYEYFHGDNGAGIGASHQTGWTGLAAFLLHYFGQRQASDALEASNLLAQPQNVA